MPIAWIAPKLVGDIVTHWHKFGERRKTVAFAVNVAHCVHIRDEFIRSGVRCEHIDGGTPKAERDASLARLATGEIEVVTNCMVLTEGWDMPEVGCCILARPTKKMGLYRQMIGRVLRPADGKTDAIVLDHSGAVFPPRIRRGSGRVDARSRSPRREPDAHSARASTARACSNARNAARSASPASRAGTAASCRSGRRARCRSATVTRLVDRSRRAQRQRLHPAERERWHAMLICDRERARLQAGMGGLQIQGKVRRLAGVGRGA